MRDVARLRWAIVTALGSSSALLASTACGGLVTRDELPSAGGGGTGGVGVGGTGGSGGISTGGTGGSGGIATGGTGGTPVVSCDFGTKVTQCFSPETAWYYAENPPQGGDTDGDALCPSWEIMQNDCCNGAKAGWESEAGECCYVFCEGGCCGRPFVIDGTQRVAAIAFGDDWIGASAAAGGSATSLSSSARERLADEWLRDGLMEHASIASFARFTLELLSLGAPPELVRAAQEAGLDEVEHARLCFGLAARFGGRQRGPGELAVGSQSDAPRTLADAVVAAFREGCVGETIAALAARRQLEHATDPGVRAALERIADDEERHAALAWRFVGWGLEQSGAGLARALRRELVALESSLPAPQQDGEACVDLSAYGRLTPAELAQAAVDTVAHVIKPCLDALLDPEPDNNADADARAAQ